MKKPKRPAGPPTQEAFDHLKAIVRSLRSRLSAQSKRAIEEREYALKQHDIQRELKSQQRELIDMLVIALLAMNDYTADEVVYFTKEHLKDQLIERCPAVASRLGRHPDEVDLSAATVNQAKEDLASGK